MTFASSAVALSGVAARLLGWRPKDFWAATPGELEAALVGGEARADEGPSRDQMDALMALHPDKGDPGNGR